MLRNLLETIKTHFLVERAEVQLLTLEQKALFYFQSCSKIVPSL